MEDQVCIHGGGSKTGQRATATECGWKAGRQGDRQASWVAGQMDKLLRMEAGHV